MSRLLQFAAAALLLASCGAPAPVQTALNAPPTAVSPRPANFPANLRWDLVPKWIAWADPKATVSWPPNDGCAAAPTDSTLAAGQTIDRFGSENGSFFSPKGESYSSRAVPYVCKAMDYRVYKVVKPIPVKTCKAAPWFGEPGGAAQIQTTQPAAKLVEAGALQVVSYVPGGSSGPSPQCGGS